MERASRVPTGSGSFSLVAALHLMKGPSERELWEGLFAYGIA